MKLLIVTLVVSSIAAVSSIIPVNSAKGIIKKPSVVGVGVKKIDQKLNIKKFNALIKAIRLKLKSSKNNFRCNNGFVIQNKPHVIKPVVAFQQTIRDVLENYGLNFLIMRLSGAQVNLKERGRLTRLAPVPCFYKKVFKYFCLHHAWFEFDVLYCPW